MALSERGIKVSNAFHKYSDTGDRSHVVGFSREEIIATMAEYSLDRGSGWYGLMQDWAAEIDAEVQYQREREFVNLNTHLAINQSLCGQLLSIDEGIAIVNLKTTSEMVADDHKLVHGDFIFGAADYAAMAAVNHPNVVLNSAEVKFLKPTISGDSVILKATVKEASGKLRRVDVEGVDEVGTKIFAGVFTCFVLEKHVLE